MILTLVNQSVSLIVLLAGFAAIDGRISGVCSVDHELSWVLLDGHSRMLAILGRLKVRELLT